VRLLPPENGNKGRVVISAGASEVSFDVAENLRRDVEITGAPFTLTIENYWPDFRIENGKPDSLSEEPNNPQCSSPSVARLFPSVRRKQIRTGPAKSSRQQAVRRRCRHLVRSTKSPHVVHR
jgi:hypothetical protein